MNLKNIIFSIAVLYFAININSCTKSILESEPTDNVAVFEYCWKAIDERYSFFETKNINWDSIKTVYSQKINNDMSQDAFFDTLANMVKELKDGHSGLTSNFNVSLNICFFSESPENFNDRLIIDNYAHGWGNITGSFKHFFLENNQIGYIYYGSFSDPISDENLKYLLEKYKDTKGLIIDIRNNFGGAVSNMYMIAKHFATEKTLVLKSRLKSGPGHNDFTEPVDIYMEPDSLLYTGKVCVLTNSKDYSCGTIFTIVMSELPNVTIVGDTTGGGTGLPIGIELPNGWQVHCAGSHLLSADGTNYELGFPPDVAIDMNPTDEDNGIDSIIEKAIDIIMGN